MKLVAHWTLQCGVFPVLLVVTVSCGGTRSETESKESTRQTEKPVAESTPRADGDGESARQALAGFSERWQKVADLPTCERASKECERAASSLQRVRETLRTAGEDRALVRALADLAIFAETARAALDSAEPFSNAERAKAPHPAVAPGSSRARPHVSATAVFIEPSNGDVKREPESTGRSGLPPELLGDTTKTHAGAFGVAARLALRHLGVYQKYGALELRRETAGELERIVDAVPEWSELGRTLAEVLPLERDRDLAARLAALAQKTRARAKAPTSKAGAAHLPLTK